MILRRFFAVAALLAVALAAAGPLSAAEKIRFTPAAFEKAQASGRPVLVEVHAPWCPVCRAQGPILSRLTAEPRFKSMQVLIVDFDSQKDVLRSLNVSKQSTLITFKGKREMGRSTGETNAAAIEGLLAKAI